MDPRFIDDLAQKLSQAVPSGFRSLQQDLESNFRAVLKSALGKLDLVTREEFEVQSEVLARTRERLKEFEGRIAGIEEAAAAKVQRKKKPARKTTRTRTGKREAKKKPAS